MFNKYILASVAVVLGAIQANAALPTVDLTEATTAVEGAGTAMVGLAVVMLGIAIVYGFVRKRG
jgi:hypothetical protein